MAVRREFVEGLYNDLLGRNGNYTPQEVEGWMGAGSEDAVREAFLGSPEYTKAHGGTQTWQNDAAGYIVPYSPEENHGYDGGGNNDVTPAPSTYTDFQSNGNDYSAFNTARQQDPGKSAKDAFAMLSNTAPPPPFASKPQLAQWFSSNIAPRMNALGHQITSVNEDGFTFTNHEGTFFVDFAQNAGAAPGSMLQRLQWNARPADAATAARYATSGGGGTAIPGGATTQRRSAGDLVGLGQQFAGPGGPGVNSGPLQQVGQDPFSQLISGALVDLIERGGSNDFGDYLQGVMKDQIEGTGTARARFESARELAHKGERTRLNDARANLAARGLLSEPGAPSGVEGGVMRRIQGDVTEEFARTIRDIASDQEDRILPVLQMATGLSQAQTANMLAAVGEGTARQTALAGIALKQLDQNMAWSQFLAEFGLKRDQTLAMLQNGQVDDLMQLIQMFGTVGSLLRGGYV